MIVPKRIHQIYWDFSGDDEEMCERWLKYSSRIKSLHPTWEYKLWDEKDCEQLVKDNMSESVYNRYMDLLPICKCDFARILIVYVQGGFYLDMDIYLHQSLDVLIRDGVQGYIFVESTTETIPYIGNAAFGFSQNHPTLEQILNASISKLNDFEVENFEGQGDGVIFSILYFLGPHFWSECCKKIQYRILPKELVLSYDKQDTYMTNSQVLFLPPQALLGWTREEKGIILGKHTTDASWKKEFEEVEADI